MNDIRLLLAIALLFMGISLNAQVVVYNTLAQYQDNTGDMYDAYLDIGRGPNPKIKFQRHGEKVKIQAKTIWGFKIEGDLFRIEAEDYSPVMLKRAGKIVYYENGYSGLHLIKYYSTIFDQGSYSYVSERIDSEIVAFPMTLISSKKKILNFSEEHPEYRMFFDCIGNDFYDYQKVRSCLQLFEEAE